ncbi:MAG TPA: bifunctional riboflavin kinase/FAD synthetase [Nostocaceae cyanobacterium]|nr:bifunctional riboflavin kinase/FAD synthetase [Nostocaceae cyanobacterium]
MLNLSQNGCDVWVASSTELALTPTAVALGKFDGIHLGHQKVIQPVLESVRGRLMPEDRKIAEWENGENLGECSSHVTANLAPTTSTKEHIYTTVVTFHPHPQEFFTGKPRTLLTPLDEKVQQLRSLGMEQLVLLPFDRELSALSPEDFVKKILVEQLQCHSISVGQDFCFGKKRMGTANDLQQLAAKYDIPVTIVPLQTDASNLSTTSNEVDNQHLEETRISTSFIRQTLEEGNIQKANSLLGRPYTLTGLVVPGQKLGRTIGFPTANLQLPKDKFIPRHGVYAVRVLILSQTQNTQPIQKLGVMNIGNRPTVSGTHTSVEIHLFDYSGDLYSQKLVVELVKFLRPEQKFSSLEELKTQIQLDCTVAKEVLSATC